MEQNPQSQLKLLVQRGKEQGYLTYAEVNDHLPEDIVDSDQIEDIIQMINDMGIQVMEEAPDADDLMLAENTADEDAAEAAAQVLSSVESEIGRTTDPVRMYMREMGTVELLTREGEIDIAKRIEDGINQVQCSVAEYPEAITYLLEQYDRVEAEEARLSDLITGFVDPNAEEDLAPTATHVGSELSQEDLDDDEDEDEEYDFDEDDDELYEITCPSCHDSILIDEGMLEEGSINCPNCNELLEFDYDNLVIEDFESAETPAEEE